MSACKVAGVRALAGFRSDPRPEDIAEVRELVAATGKFNAEEVEVAAELVRERLGLGAASGYAFLFADETGTLQGYSCYGPIPGTKQSFDLYWIAVRPQRQGQGLGSRLLAASEAAAAAAGGGRLYVDTSGRADYAPTRGFYQRHGFRLEAQLPDFYAPGDDKLVYVKLLAAARAP